MKVKFLINQTGSQEKALSEGEAMVKQLVDLFIGFGMNVLGFCTPIASVAFLVKSIIQIYQKDRFTYEEARLLLLSILGIIPGISFLVGILNMIYYSIQFYDCLKSI